MANYQVSIAIDTVIEAVGAFLNPFVVPSEIIRGQVNRVPMPLTGFVQLTELRIVPIETPWVSVTDLVMTITGPARIDVQVDFYGPASGDQCAAIEAVLRSGYSTAQFPANVQPLYASDGVQSAMVTGEAQYESRWTLTLSLQYNPIITVVAESANKLAFNIIEEIP